MAHLEDLSLKEEYDQDYEDRKPVSYASEYLRALAIYKDEEYSQESDSMILQISQDPKIPSKIRQKQPLYNLLVYTAKSLLLNEYEIVGLATQIDGANWNFKQDLKLSDKAIKNLNLGPNIKIDSETKTLAMYLLIMGYFIKDGLNEASELRKITSHCEEIYHNFKNDYKAWQKKYLPRLDVISINKKWKHFRNPKSVKQPEPEEHVNRDYNHIVNDIVQLTGYHSSKNDFDVLLELGRSMHEAQTLPKPNPTSIITPIPTNTTEDEGPRTLPMGFSMAPLENRYKSSRGGESAFVCSRETSKELFENAKKVIFVSYSNTPEPTGIIPNFRSLTQAELEELFEYTAPSKKIKKTASNEPAANEDESKIIEKKNSLFRFFTPLMEVDQSLFEREPSFLGDSSGIGRLFSKNP